VESLIPSGEGHEVLLMGLNYSSMTVQCILYTTLYFGHTVTVWCSVTNLCIGTASQCHHGRKSRGGRIPPQNLQWGGR
jgi:hypothetical protein